MGSKEIMKNIFEIEYERSDQISHYELLVEIEKDIMQKINRIETEKSKKKKEDLKNRITELILETFLMI